MSVPIITLLTDFGTRDTYVGQMQGIILGLVPEARIVHLTHEISPQNVRAGALALADACDAFPPGTIHLTVVDPGVGSARRACAAEIGEQRFVGPDNGLWSLVIQRYGLKQAVELTNSRWHRSHVSRTFHGRDIFSPVAAAWAKGTELTEFGPLITDELVPLSWPAVITRPGQVRGEVLWVDHFGNLITNLTADYLPKEHRAHCCVRIAGQELTGWHPFYAAAPPGSLIALLGSSGRLEVAVNGGSAERVLGCGTGTPVEVNW